MDKFYDLLNQLKECGATCDSGDIFECLPEAVYKEHFAEESNYKELAKRLDVDKHRWYETSITVFEIYGGILGVRHVTDIFSESMDWSDCGFTPAFFEMVAVPSTTYIVKK